MPDASIVVENMLMLPGHERAERPKKDIEAVENIKSLLPRKWSFCGFTGKDTTIGDASIIWA